MSFGSRLRLARDAAGRTLSVPAIAMGLCLAGIAPTHATEDEPRLRSALGSYMAGRLARNQFDGTAAAAYFGRALGSDATNEQIAALAFESEATEGNWPRAEELASKLVALKADHRLAQMMLGLKAFRASDFDKANRHFEAAAVEPNSNPVSELISLLARGWVRVASDRGKEALDLLDQTKQPEWASPLIRYHRALMADVAGRRADARASYDRLFVGEQRSLRTVLAYAQHLATSGDAKAAQKVLQTYLAKSRGDGHPTARALLEQLTTGTEPGLLITTASQGLSEAFFQLGEALAGESGLGPGAIFLQYALYVEPSSVFALTALANVYEAANRHQRAIEIYDRIPPGTPFEMAVDIRKAINLNLLDKVEEAKTLLESVAERDPDDLRPLDALGSIMRGHKRYDEAIGYYSRAIKLVKKPEAKHWNLFYARGTSYERTKRWPLAEVDLQTALRLSPDQPMVLNYLGYSWVDQGRNLKQGLAYIEKAVRLRPDDGYIIDSLGWAHYRLGNFNEAVRWLERAVEKKADDPTLNDHLGDAYWRVGRKTEAKFQWSQALSLKPEPEEETKIRQKLEKGLQPLTNRSVRKPEPKSDLSRRRAAQSKSDPSQLMPQ